MVVPEIVWTILELYFTGLIHLFTAILNPFGIFGTSIPRCDPTLLQIFLGNYYLRNSFVSREFSIINIIFGFGIEFSITTYTLTFIFPYFSTSILLGTTFVDFWKSSLPHLNTLNNGKSEKSSSASETLKNTFSSFLSLLPNLKLSVENIRVDVNNDEAILCVKGFEFQICPSQDLVIKVKVDDIELKDSSIARPVLHAKPLSTVVVLSTPATVDCEFSSIAINLESLSESKIIHYLQLLSGLQYYSPQCIKELWLLRWNELNVHLTEIEQIHIDRQSRWRGDDMDDSLFFYDTHSSSSYHAASVNMKLKLGKLVIESCCENRSEEDIVIHGIHFETKTTLEVHQDISIQRAQANFTIKSINNGYEEQGGSYSGIDEFLSVENEVTKNYDKDFHQLLQLSSKLNCVVGDLTLAIPASFLRGVLTLLDRVKYLGKKGVKVTKPANYVDAKFYEQESESDFSSGSINLLIKPDECSENSVQQNVLIRLGHGSKYTTPHRSTIVLDSIQVYLGNYDVDIHSLDGMMLYGNAIIAIKSISLTLPKEEPGIYYFPRADNLTGSDWIVNANSNGSEVVTDVNVKNASVHLSQSDIVSMVYLVKSITKYQTGNECSVFDSLKVHAYHVAPAYKRTTRVLIAEINLSLATDNPLQRYQILRNKNMKLKLSSIGNWWSSTSFKMSDNIDILYVNGSRGAGERLLMRIWAVPMHDDDHLRRRTGNRSIEFNQITSFSELYCRTQRSIGVGFRMSTSMLRIPNISMVVDVEDIKPLLVIKAACQTCYPVDFSDSLEVEKLIVYRPDVLFVTKSPSSVFHFENKQLKISMYHTAEGVRLPAVEVSSSGLEIGQVDFAGCSSQLSVTVTNLRLLEMSHPIVAHKVILDSIDATNYASKIHIHITSVKGENGIFELQAEHLRVLYLQRSTMTLITFLRDHFFGAMSEVSQHVPKRPITTKPAPMKGLYRLCMVVRRSEFHLPTSSNSSDSLVVFFRRLIFYRTSDEYEKSLAAYVKGPFHSRKLWLSEMQQIRKFMLFAFGGGASANTSSVDSPTQQSHSGSVVWKLPVYLHEFMYTYDDIPVGDAYLRLQLFEGSITSWCNNNLICTAMDATALVKMNPSNPNAEEAIEIFEGESYLMPAYTIRNTIIVEVFADEIEWVMAQGQYWLIVNAIQQNFMEWNFHIIDPFILPVFKKVDLGERILGKDPFNRELPIASTVPVNIKKGSIIAAQNDEDFLKNFIAFMPLNETFDETFHHSFEKQIVSTIPVNAPFHRFRDPLFSRWAKSETKREKLKEYHHGLETPFALKFENLFLDFYRFHFGGGSGIEASATTLILQQQARSEFINEGVRAQMGSTFDDTDIRDLVLAPRHLSVFHSKDSAGGHHQHATASPIDENVVDSSTKTETIRHIRYSQQGVANLRRCVVYISDTVVTVNLTTILAAVDFFVIPIQLTTQRNLQLVEQRNKGPFDYRGGLDVEVHMERSYICIPDPVNGINALCFDMKLDYLQSLRGFLSVGPGLALTEVDADINNIFMAPLNEVNDVFMKPLVDPVKFRFLNEFTVLAPRETLAKHLDVLNSWTTFSSWVTELPNRYDRASGHRIMRFFIGPLRTSVDEEDEDDNNSNYIGKMEEPAAKVIRGQCSIKDLAFIISVVNGIRRSLKRRIQNLPKEDIYRHIIANVDDMKHLMSLDEQLVFVPWTYDVNVDVKEVHADLSNFDFHVRNNTYNVNIGRLKLEDIIIIYARGPDHMHMATEVRLDAWTFNDDMDDWEPFIEPIQLRALGATDASRSVDETVPSTTLGMSEAPSIRIDVITDGLEINAQQQSLNSLIRKIRLGDVLTTSSNRLPPYMIINELGVNCKFTIGIQSTIVLASEIQAAASFPVEVSRLTDSLNSFKRQRAYQSQGDDDNLFSNMDTREYFIWISFHNFSHSYESKAALCIDKVGVHPFDMQMLRGGGKRDSQVFRKSSDAAVDSQGHPEPMRYAQELPYAILDMRIKEDGVRELHLRGWLSFKNTTGRLMQISLRLYGSCYDSSLAPGKEWHAPVRYANPKTQLFIRFDQKSDWTEALPYLGMIIAGGSWGCPSKLRARLCRCYREHDDPDTTDEPRWMLLIRPEAKAIKSIGLATTTSYKASSILVKYPNRDNNTKTKFGVGQMIDEGPDNFQIDEGQMASVISGTVSGFSSNFLTLDQSQIRPVCINLQAPLQFCSFLPQPLLYRLVDQEGTYCASGVLLPGQTMDIHNISMIFQHRFLISVRMLNYAWSDYVIVFGRSNPYSNAEKSTELTLQSLLFQSQHTGKDILLPSLCLTMIVKEFFVRFTCQMVISNCSGQELHFAESGNTDMYLPLGSTASVRDYLDVNVPAKRKSLHSRAFVRRSYVNYTADSYVDSEDEEEDGEDGSRGSAISDDGHHGSDHRMSDLHSAAGASTSMVSGRVSPVPFTSGRLSPLPMMGLEPGTNIRFKQIINMKIHLPQDHQKVIEVVASTSWTLEDLFMDIKHRIDNHGLEFSANEFKFFPWIIDEKLLTAKHIQPAVEDGDDDNKSAAQVRPISQNINIGNEMPLNMRFDLVMVLNGEAWNMRAPLSSLNTSEILLCHDSEVAIHRQVSTIRGESISKEGIKALFGKTKFVYRAQMARITGEFPFKPYRMLGNPLLSISVPTETDWSAGIDVVKGEFDTGEMVITLANKRVAETPYNPVYEFGIYLERGSGFMQQATVATIVPKHILVSRLSYPIDIRQIDFDYAPSIIFLEPNSSCNFHYPNRSRLRLLQVKKSPIMLNMDFDDNSSKNAANKSDNSFSDKTVIDEGVWAGEVDINKLGIVYVRLRNPLAIIKVETEVVGGSLVSTFSEQSLIWPPYRIDNKSAAKIRFREDYSVSANAASLDLLTALLPEQARLMTEETGSSRDSMFYASTSVSHKDNGPAPAANRTASTSTALSSQPSISPARITSGGSTNATTSVVPITWDEIESKGSFPYTWDHPFSGNRSIRLEIAAAGQVASKLVSLDEDIKDLTVTLKKKVPNLGNPLAEGYLTRCETNNAEKEVYCILRPDILYIYEKDENDPTKHELLDLINLSKIKRSGKYVMGSVTRLAPEKSKDFLSNTFTDFFTNISSTVNFLRQRTKMRFDVNYIRTLMLKLGDNLGFFAQFSADSKLGTRRRAYSDEHDVGLSLAETRENNGSNDSLDSLIKDSSVSPSLIDGSNVPGVESTAADSASVNSRLKELLSAGTNPQDMMDELPKHIVFTHQVIDAILVSNEKYTMESAKELCAWLILHEYLIPYDPAECIRTFSIDGGAAPRASVFDPSFLNGVDFSSSANLSSGPTASTADSRPPLNTTASSASINTAPVRPTGTLLGMARASKAMQYYHTLLQDCENMEMVFVPPPLNPEMLELQMSMLDELGGAAATAAAGGGRASIVNSSTNNAANSTTRTGEEIFGFTITISDRVYSFKCASGDEFRGWIQSARLAVELGWVDYMTGRKPLVLPKISDYQITYHLKTRADGSTKVLEITEVGGGQEDNKKIVKMVTSTLADAFSFLPAFRRNKRALQVSNLEELKEGIDADRALISVFFNVRSVSLSIIDSSPAEVMYIRLQDVVMNVIRYLRAVQFTVTVRQLQFVDQLLNPSFPVTLFTRKLSPDEAKKIVLPGFDDGDVFGYPSLHLHLQQRYFKSAKSTPGSAGNNAGGNAGGGAKNDNTSVSPAITSESKLWYFDVFTLWLAPMHLGVDEEIFVRLFRFIHSIRSTLQELEAGGKTRKIHEDTVGSTSADYRLLSTDLDRNALHANYMQLVESGRSPYAMFATETKRALNMYFGLLQLYPLEVSISFRPSPDVKLTNAEYAIVSIIAQLDNAKIKLNSLFAENAFGSTVIIKEIIAKHYRAAFWKQFRNLIGATDIVEGSVGLVANLGTGVYDLFSESVEGLNPNEKKSFLHGLSRGGMSFATHTIGGTSGFTSRIAGGIGKGVSMLTLDTEFQRNRTYRKYNQANTLSEGLYVGTQELGRNIVEGVTGIVVSPYRGWEQGGGVGLATGMARGILGVALKPAVGVLDLASRATEGLRNTTMQTEIGYSAEIEGVRRCRIPRAFGRSGMLQIYDVRAAAAQCMADYLADFRYEPRLHVVAHSYARRKIETVRGMSRPGGNNGDNAKKHNSRPRSHGHSNAAVTMLVGEAVEEDEVNNASNTNNHVSFGRPKSHSNTNARRYEDSAQLDFTTTPSREAWGLCEEAEYVILVTPDRVALVEVNSSVPTANTVTTNTSAAGSQPATNLPNMSTIAEECDVDDNMSVSSKMTTATAASSVQPPPSSTPTGMGGGMFGAFRSKTKKFGSFSSAASTATTSTASSSAAGGATAGVAGNAPSGVTVNNSGSQAAASGSGSSVSVVTSLPTKRCRFIWVCPANCIDELSSDNRGDMQLKLNTSLLMSGPWHQRQPTILDATIRNYTVFQSLLEQVVGVSLARQQPLQPPYRPATASAPARIGGLLQQGIRKKYSTGIRSVLMSPSVHTYWVYGHVLYEYTAVRGSAAAANAAKLGIAGGNSSNASSSSNVLNVNTAYPLLTKANSTLSPELSPVNQSDLSEYFRIDNAVEDLPTAGIIGYDNSSSSRPASGMYPSTSSANDTTTVAGPASVVSNNNTNTTSTHPAAANVALSPIDDLMQKTIAALAVTPTKTSSSSIQSPDGDNARQHKKRHRRKRHSSTSSAAPAPLPGDNYPEKDSDDDDEAYYQHQQQLMTNRERRSSSAASGGSLLSEDDGASLLSQTSFSNTPPQQVVPPPELQDQYLSFVYPLVDITMHGPTPEDGGKCFSISIQRMDNAKMRCLRRDDPNELLSEYMKSGLSLLFPTKEMAMNWRLAIESRITLRPTDCLPQALLTTEEKKRDYGRFLPLSGRSTTAVQANGEKQTLENVLTPVDNSVLGVLVLPTSGCAEKETETIKIEIFKTLSAVRRL